MTHFPEQAGAIYLINAPQIVQRIWALIKKFLDPATAQRCTIYSGCPVEKLNRNIDKTVIPEEWGGTNPLKLHHVKMC